MNRALGVEKTETTDPVYFSASAGANFRVFYAFREPGFIEVESQDCFAEWRVTTSIGAVERVQYAQTGPAGSRSAIRVGGPSVVEVRSAGFPMAVTDHVDPYTGCYNAAGVRAQAFRASLFPVDPSRQEDVYIRLGGGTSTAEMPVLPAAATTVIGYAPGYCRSLRIDVDQWSGALIGAHPGGAGAAWAPLASYSEPLPGGRATSRRWHPWVLASLQNSTALTPYVGVEWSTVGGD